MVDHGLDAVNSAHQFAQIQISIVGFEIPLKADGIFPVLVDAQPGEPKRRMVLKDFRDLAFCLVRDGEFRKGDPGRRWKRSLGIGGLIHSGILE